MDGLTACRPRTTTVGALCAAMLLVVAACSSSGTTTPPVAPATQSPSITLAADEPTTVPGPTDTPRTPEATASVEPDASAAALPVRRVFDLPYARSTLPEAVTGVKPGSEIRLDVFAPETGGSWPVVVWAPGGNETKEMGQAFGDSMASSGAVVFLVDTIRSLDPAVPPLGSASRGLVEGAACIVRTARALAPEYGGDPGRVVWSGHSLGGAYGFELALADPNWERMWADRAKREGGPGPMVECLTRDGASTIDAIATASSGRFINAFPNVYDADPAVRTFTDSVSHVGNNPSLKVRLVHGDSDFLVPPSRAEAFERELAAAGYDASLNVVPLQGHALFFPELVEQIREITSSPDW